MTPGVLSSFYDRRIVSSWLWRFSSLLEVGMANVMKILKRLFELIDFLQSLAL